jgi:hypothetical protein
VGDVMLLDEAGAVDAEHAVGASAPCPCSRHALGLALTLQYRAHRAR